MKIVRPLMVQTVRTWMVRYAPSEIVGTITAFAAFWFVYHASGSLAAAAIAGTLGENSGYYGIAISREVIHYWRLHKRQRAVRRMWIVSTLALRNLAIEFGLAEAVDSLLIRPGLFYALPLMFPQHIGLGLIIAKIVADVCFYGFAIMGYEFRRRVLADKDTETAA